MANECVLSELQYQTFCQAIIDGQLSIIEKILDEVFLEQDATITPDTFMQCSSMYGGMSPLVLAAQHGHIEIVDYLTTLLPQQQFIDMCASVYGIAHSGDELHHVTALNAACIQSHLPIVKMLHSKNASLSIPDCTGAVPLNEASFHGRLDVVQYLCEQGADVHVCNDSGWEPHHVAVFRNQSKVFTCLVDHGADCTHCTPEGFTVLHIAAASGHVEMVKTILKMKNVALDPLQSSTYNGHHVPSPLHLAAAFSHQSRAHQSIVELFVRLPGCSAVHLVDMYLLIGVSNVMNFDELNALSSWQKATDIISKNEIHIPPADSACECYLNRSEIRNSDQLAQICALSNPHASVEMLYQTVLIWERCIGFHDMTYWDTLNRTADVLLQSGLLHERELLVFRGFQLADKYLVPKLASGHILPQNFEAFYDSWVGDCFLCSQKLAQQALTTRASTNLNFTKILCIIFKAVNALATRYDALTLKYGCQKRTPRQLLSTVIQVFSLWQSFIESDQCTNKENALTECHELGMELVHKFLLFSDGNTLLHLLQNLGVHLSKNVALYDFFLQCGANRALHIRFKGLMCLHLACVQYCPEIIDVLLQYGAHIDAVDEKGRTPLDIVKEHHPKKVEDFLSRFLLGSLSLQCLSAVAILRYRVSYSCLPPTVKYFISLHDETDH